jgi:L-seryl-tRNA(Ser) seleniumtransferase
MGSGSLPLQNLATTLVAIRPEQGGAEAVAKQLRLCATPVFTRIQNDQVLLDPRTLRDGDDAIIVQAVTDVLSMGG